MGEYKIFTDSTCDIKPKDLEKWGVGYFPLVFYFTDDEKNVINDTDMPAKAFYDEMRKGRIAKTAGTNIANIKEAFRKELSDGYDILYLGFSSAMSMTYNSGVIAAEEMAEEFPERKIYTVDTLAQSAGQGLLIKLTVDYKNKGATIEEARDFAEDRKLHIAHWFSVDDLTYLKRGGRLSAASAFVATVLNIKPVLHTDNDGCLVAMEKIRGRKQAIKRIIEKYGELAIHPNEGPVFLCHSDDPEGIEFMEKLLFDTYGVKPEYIADVGPVIGSHIGPGTVSIFFETKER